ncbi:hypothetical protein BCR34DRAFT_16311 [Clohesyomyces aquaticus]|uniref:Uncharacterized protein n=1 Tax=Clohesyomyces aquaticus TaxID=1231657 RepID=A0A1Y1ZCD6_9PLEO|nr:hypothetical protein BCR34DRAFT_16311 [Clohesyomyces aquaticus]
MPRHPQPRLPDPAAKPPYNQLTINPKLNKRSHRIVLGRRRLKKGAVPNTWLKRWFFGCCCRLTRMEGRVKRLIRLGTRQVRIGGFCAYLKLEMRTKGRGRWLFGGESGCWWTWSEGVVLVVRFLDWETEFAVWWSEVEWPGLGLLPQTIYSGVKELAKCKDEGNDYNS